MPFQLIRGDVTVVRADKIVTNADFLPPFSETPRTFCRTAVEHRRRINAARSAGRRVEPVMQGACPPYGELSVREDKMLYSRFRDALAQARESGCESIALPLLTAGYSGSTPQAIRTATRAISDFLDTNEMSVFLVLSENEAAEAAAELSPEICRYIKDNYSGEPDRGAAAFSAAEHTPQFRMLAESDLCCDSMESIPEPCDYCAAGAPSLEDALANLDLSFSQKLFALIDASGMTDPQVYKRANIDRKLFSKIRSDIHYRPKKNTVLAFAIALKLSPAETEALLNCAGYTLSHSSKADVIVEFFLQKGEYDIYEINRTLFAYDQALIGE